MVCHPRVALITALLYFGHLDIRSLAETFKFSRRLAQQEPLKSYLVGKAISRFHVCFLASDGPPPPPRRGDLTWTVRANGRADNW